MSPEQWSINKVNCYKTPIPHIWSNTIVSRDIYDRLYEQWDNIEHTHWRKFINDKEIEIYFHNDFTNALTPKKNKEYIGYWFFQQRTDKSKGGEVELINGINKKQLNYWYNSILIIETSKNFIVRPRKHQLPERPFCEIYFNKVTNEKIKKLLN